MTSREYIRLSRVDPSKVPERTFKGEARLAKLVSVYDGDTITVITRLSPQEPFRQYKVRLYGIDTPEMRPPLNEPHRELHKKAANCVKQAILDKCPIGSILMINFQNEDKYGRLLGTSWTTKKGWLWRISTKENLCLWLIKKGYALSYSGGKKQDFTHDQLLNITDSD